MLEKTAEMMYPSTKEFLYTAIQEKAHLVPPSGPDRRLRWIRDRNITGARYLSGQSLREIGETYGGITPERVRQIVRETMKLIHDNCMEETQARFPFESIPLAIPTSRKMREQKSLRNGGLTIKIGELAEKGLTVSEIEQSLGVAKPKLNRARNRLRRWGISIPYSIRRPETNTKLHDRLTDISSTDDEVKQALSEMNYGFYERELKSEEPAIFPLSTGIKAAGYSTRKINLSLIKKILDSKIPVGHLQRKARADSDQQIHYYFIATQHQQRLAKAIESDPELSVLLENPVKSVTIPNGAIPSTTELVQRKGYTSVVNVLRELGIPFSNYDKNPINHLILPDCPTPIFKYANGYFYPTDEKDRLTAYIRERLLAS